VNGRETETFEGPWRRSRSLFGFHTSVGELGVEVHHTLSTLVSRDRRGVRVHGDRRNVSTVAEGERLEGTHGLGWVDLGCIWRG
jgi:hypothetical protein